MLIECLVKFCVFTNCCVFGGFVFWMCKYSYVIDQLTKMRQTFLMEQVARILNVQPQTSSELNIALPSIPLDDKRNDGLSAVVAGGNSKKYFGKEYTITEIENLSVNERDKLYSRYEAKLGREIISSLGSVFTLELLHLD